jgi:geranylgeranyl reductase family protein
MTPADQPTSRPSTRNRRPVYREVPPSCVNEGYAPDGTTGSPERKGAGRQNVVMERFEVAVVGAGPAGATAARLLAASGARVVLLEARPIPRHKLCGGGLTPKAMPYLVPAARSTIVREIERVELAGARVPSLHLRLPQARIALVERAPFDAALVGAASLAGATVRDAWAVHEIKLLDDGARLRGPTGALEADVVVAADGDPSRIATRLEFAAPRRRSLGLEVDLPFAPGRRRDELQLRFGVAGGYAWYFPKADHANVGILSWRSGRQAGLRAALRRYVTDLGLRPDDRAVKGHWIPQELRRGPAVRGRVLLVGDAAATGDPFFGEGISFAMASAVLAARAIRDWSDGHADLAAYDGALVRRLGPAMRQLQLVSMIADLAPTLSIAALRTLPWARNQAIQGIAGTAAPFLLPHISAATRKPVPPPG